MQGLGAGAGLRNSADLVGQAPEEDGDDDGPPHLCEEVEHGERPVAVDGEGRKERAGEDGCQIVCGGGRVQHLQESGRGRVWQGV